MNRRYRQALLVTLLNIAVRLGIIALGIVAQYIHVIMR